MNLQNLKSHIKNILSSVATDEAQELIESIQADIECEKRTAKFTKVLSEIENPLITTKELALVDSSNTHVFKSAVEYYLKALSETIYQTKCVGGSSISLPVYERGIASHRLFLHTNQAEKLAFYIHILDSTYEDRPTFHEHILPFLLETGYKVEYAGSEPYTKVIISW